MEENSEVDEQEKGGEEEEEETCICPKLHIFFLSGTDLKMDFAYLMLTFLQLHPRKLPVLQRAPAVGVI